VTWLSDSPYFPLLKLNNLSAFSAVSYALKGYSRMLSDREKNFALAVISRKVQQLSPFGTR
jgi:hypothetical protein